MLMPKNITGILRANVLMPNTSKSCREMPGSMFVLACFLWPCLACNVYFAKSCSVSRVVVNRFVHLNQPGSILRMDPQGGNFVLQESLHHFRTPPIVCVKMRTNKSNYMQIQASGWLEESKGPNAKRYYGKFHPISYSYSSINNARANKIPRMTMGIADHRPN